MLKGFFPGPGSYLLAVGIRNMRMWSKLGRWSHHSFIPPPPPAILHSFQKVQNVASGWFLYIMNWVSLALSGCVPQGECDSDFKFRRIERCFALRPQHRCHRSVPSVRWRLLEFGQLLSYCRCSAQVKSRFLVMLCCWDNELCLGAFQTPPGIYFMHKFDFLFWGRCLLDLRVCLVFESHFLDLADGCRKWSQGFIWVFVVLFWSIWLLYPCCCKNVNLFR